jgi:2-epi-5-epi-valiolone 7-phosphate 2-epimerase
VAVWELDVGGRDAIGRVARLGLGCVHMDLADLDREGEDGCRALTDLCARTGVAIVGLGVNRLNAVGLRRDEDAARRTIERAVDRAIALRVPVVHLPAFREAAIRTEDDVRLAARALRYARAAAGESGVVIATENALSADACAGLLDAVARPDVGVLFDCLNPVFAGHDPLAILARFADRLAPVVHVKDGTPGRKGDARVGRGVGRVAQSLAELARLGWRGALVLENDYSVDADPRIAEDAAAVARLMGSPLPAGPD